MVKKWVQQGLVGIRGLFKWCCHRGAKQEDEQKIPLLLEDTQSEDSEPDEKRDGGKLNIFQEKAFSKFVNLIF